MQYGKSIRIYLKDGTVTGIKQAEIVNQTIQSYSCPRLRISELASYSEAQRPGVYFLFGEDEENGEPMVYIGEAENVYHRLQQHTIHKDFWNEAIIFVSKDDNLTKSHVKYLESRIIEAAFAIKRYKIDNFNQASLSSLPLPDRDGMEEFLSYIKLLIGVYGHKVLEEVIKNPKKTSDIPTANTLDESVSLVTLPLFLSISGIKANAIQTDEGIVILKGSEAAKESTPYLSEGYKIMRQKLIDDKKLELVGDKLIFQDDVLFPSASQAGVAVVGYNINGRVSWKDANGKSLKEIEEQKVA